MEVCDFMRTLIIEDGEGKPEHVWWRRYLGADWDVIGTGGNLKLHRAIEKYSHNPTDELVVLVDSVADNNITKYIVSEIEDYVAELEIHSIVLCYPCFEAALLLAAPPTQDEYLLQEFSRYRWDHRESPLLISHMQSIFGMGVFGVDREVG